MSFCHLNILFEITNWQCLNKGYLERQPFQSHAHFNTYPATYHWQYKKQRYFLGTDLWRERGVSTTQNRLFPPIKQHTKPIFFFLKNAIKSEFRGFGGSNFQKFWKFSKTICVEFYCWFHQNSSKFPIWDYSEA